MVFLKDFLEKLILKSADDKKIIKNYPACEELIIMLYQTKMDDSISTERISLEYIILISQPKHMLWILKRTILMRHTFKLMGHKIITILHSFFIYLSKSHSIYLIIYIGHSHFFLYI